MQRALAPEGRLAFGIGFECELDLRLLVLLEPLLAADAVDPEADVHFAPDEDLALPVLLAKPPAADVDAAVAPLVLALAVELVGLEVAEVHLALAPRQLAEAVHLVGDPGTDVSPPIDPIVSALAFDGPVAEVSQVGAAVGKRQLAFAVLAVKHILALVSGAVGPGLDSSAVFLALAPLAFIAATKAT